MTLDVLYVVSGKASDRCLFKRLKCSIDSVLANDHPEINIGICDTSLHNLKSEFDKYLKPAFNYVYHKRQGEYNKSFNINLAVKQLSTAEHIMVTDLDMVFSTSHISRCFSLVEKFPVITYATHSLNSEFYSSDFNSLLKRQGKHIPIGGGFFASRDAFLQLNGFDEEYYGWGAEDSDFYDRAEQLFQIKRPCSDIQVIHLWHKVNDKNKAINKVRNLRRYLERRAFIKNMQVEPWDVKSCLRE